MYLLRGLLLLRLSTRFSDVKQRLLINWIVCAGMSLFGLSALYFAFLILKRPDLASLHSQSLVAAHEGKLTSQEIIELRQEFSKGFNFTDISFEEIPFRGQYVNKLLDGSRFSVFNDACVGTPKERIVWVFGGSTTYGYGVPDDQTIPSQLSNALNERTGEIWCIKNFARGFYYSSQEVNLLVNLLRESSNLPGSVVFIDGLNDFYHLSRSSFTPSSQFKTQDFFTNSALTIAELFLKGVGRIQRALNPELSSAYPHSFGVYRVISTQPTAPMECTALMNKPSFAGNAPAECRLFLEKAALRLLRNWDIASTLSSSVGAEFVPVLQPVPAYPAGARNLNPFIPVEGLGQHEFSGHGYVSIKKLLDNQLDLSGIFAYDNDASHDGKKCNSYYVDPVHYTGCSAGLIANKIADQILR